MIGNFFGGGTKLLKTNEKIVQILDNYWLIWLWALG